MTKDLEFVPVKKIDTTAPLPQSQPADRVSMSGIGLDQPLPGINGAFVRFYHGYIKACRDVNDPVSPDIALSGAYIDKSLKTPENSNGEIENRTLGAILPHVPNDVFAFQIIKTETLARIFFLKAKIVEKADSPIFWLGTVDRIENQLVLRTVNGDCVALEETDKVLNQFGVQVWPEGTGYKAVVPSAEKTAPQLKLVE
jgi:hypothetical protein